MDALRNSGRMLSPLQGNYVRGLLSSLLDGTTDISSLAKQALKSGLSGLESRLGVDPVCLSHVEIFLEALLKGEQWTLKSK